MSLRGSSFVATSAPKRFAGIRRPRPLMHGAAQAIVSPKTFSWLKTEASRAGNVIGNSPVHCGPLVHLVFSRRARFSLSWRAKFSAQNRRTQRCRPRKMISASTGLKCTRARPPSTAASSPRLSAMFENGSGDVLLASRVAAFAVWAIKTRAARQQCDNYRKRRTRMAEHLNREQTRRRSGESRYALRPRSNPPTEFCRRKIRGNREHRRC